MSSEKKIQEKLKEAEVPDFVQELFLRQVQRLKEGALATISSRAISPAPDLPTLSDLEAYAAKGRELIGKLIVLKLNGGLGTSMGLEKAKSLLAVREGKTFLDIICDQVSAQRENFGIQLPLVLMNSFRTEADTEAHLERHPGIKQGNGELPTSVVQHQVPRLLKDSLEPLSWPTDPSLEWCPPGHGDLYSVLLTRGLLTSALENGYRYVFVSNSDNLGASVDPALLGYLAEQGSPFLMETARRTEADKKGGHLALAEGGQLILREKAQCAPEDRDDFQDIERHRYFNTNSLWLDLQQIGDALQQGRLELPVIANEKNADPRDDSTPEVLQLETAMGSAISVLEGSTAVEVPRSRFLPVKTTDDLLVLRSDRYSLTEGSELSAQSSEPIVVELDPRFYRTMQRFEERFPDGSPSLKGCLRLTVSGDLLFKAGVVCREGVIVRNTSEEQAVIAEGTQLSGEVEISEKESSLT